MKGKESEDCMSCKAYLKHVPWILFGILLALFISGQSGFALEPVTYLDAAGEEKTLTADYDKLENLTDAEGISMYWDKDANHNSWYVLTGEKTFENRLNAFGAVRIILKDGATLNCKKGINVPAGSSLTICAQSKGSDKGKLIADARSADYCAGIGGDDEKSAGAILIAGGDIKAYGGRQAAGIGGGDKGDATEITIYDGDVYAKNGAISDSIFATSCSGAAIGGGRWGAAGKININGGNIDAKSGHRGAAIGTGGDADRSSTSPAGNCKGGLITIKGGSINADANSGDLYKKDGGAGIGGGADSHAVEVIIEGGSITAYGSHYDYESDQASNVWGLKASAVIGNGYDTVSSERGIVTIKGGSNSGPYIHCVDRGYRKQATRAMGSSGADDKCEVKFDYPGGTVDVINKYIAKSEDRLSALKEGNSVKVSLCKHDRAEYTREADYHIVECPNCNFKIEKEAHHYGERFGVEAANHWNICSVCGYEDVENKVLHDYDAETGICECGQKGTKITYDPGNSASGKEKIVWASGGEEYTLPDPADLGYDAPQAAEFKGWSVNGSQELSAAGDKVKVMGETTIVPLYKGTWSAFKQRVESAKSGDVIKLMEDTVGTEADEAILIGSRRKVTVDLNGHTLDRNANSGAGEVFKVEGSLAITDSSEAQTGTIKGGSGADIAGGGITVNGGTLELTGGKITNNDAQKGGGVYVKSGTFTMSGGTIEDNTAGNAGSGVYVENGQFSMTGGAVTGNIMNVFGLSDDNIPVVGGVQTGEGGKIRISGSAQIINNRTMNVSGDFWSLYRASNVLLREGERIEVAGELDKDYAAIGVSLSSDADEQGTVVTKGFKGSPDIFLSDEAAFAVGLDNKGEVLLILDAESFTHKITVKQADGGRVEVDKDTVREGGTAALHAVADEGYIFMKWNVSGSGARAFPSDSAASTLYVGTEDVTVTPSFAPSKVDSMVIKAFRGTDELLIGSKIEILAVDELKLQADLYPKNVQATLTWESDDPSVVSIDSEGNLKANGIGTAKITASAGGYVRELTISVAASKKVTFDADNGEDTSDVYVGTNGTVSEPEDPSYEGHTFQGWYKVVKDESTGLDTLSQVKYDFTSRVDSDFTLKAVWKHDLTEVPLKTATCTEEGNAPYWVCESCGKHFADAEGTMEYSEGAWIIEPMHHWGALKDSEDGQTHYRECELCHEKQTEQHEWDEGEIIKAPTAEADGEVKFTCSKCGAAKTENIAKLEQGEHGIIVTKEDTQGNLSEGGSVKCSLHKGKKGDSVKVVADEYDGYCFIRWIVSGGEITNPYARYSRLVLADSDATVTAVFAEGKLTSIYDADVVLSKTSFTYNGKVQKPAIKTVSGYTLVEGTDYTADWSDPSSKNAGTYTVTLVGKGDYVGLTEAKYTIQKAANTLSVKAKTATVKYKKLKKKNQTLSVTKVIKFSNKGYGAKKYTLSAVKKGSKSFRKYFKINSKTGKITIKKKLKKGTYKVTVKVGAAGDVNHNSMVKTVTFKVKVK